MRKKWKTIGGQILHRSLENVNQSFLHSVPKVSEVRSFCILGVTILAPRISVCLTGSYKIWSCCEMPSPHGRCGIRTGKWTSTHTKMRLKAIWDTCQPVKDQENHSARSVAWVGDRYHCSNEYPSIISRRKLSLSSWPALWITVWNQIVSIIQSLRSPQPTQWVFFHPWRSILCRIGTAWIWVPFSFISISHPLWRH